jgi:hypothetical protein
MSNATTQGAAAMKMKRIDWKAKAEYAADLTDAQIWAAIVDCQKTLPSADALVNLDKIINELRDDLTKSSR